MSSMALDHHDPEDLRRAYQRHDTVKEAAQEFSVSYSTVRRRMIQYGIHTPCSHSRYGTPYGDSGSHGRSIPAHGSEPEVFELCWRLYRRGETDLLEAGVPPATIAILAGAVDHVQNERTPPVTAEVIIVGIDDSPTLPDTR